MSRASRRLNTGVFWDENLDLYLGGAININCYNNVLGFKAGETISGSIDIEISDIFEAQDLTIEFKGVERSHISTTDSAMSVKPFHREEKEIISLKQVVKTFSQGDQLQPGQYTFCFQIFTPDWLPESSIFKTKKDRFTVEYTLRA